LGRISKRGDVYLRTMLIHGARAVIAQIERKPDHAEGWLKKLLARRNKNVAAVALAAKNARIAWALLAHERIVISRRSVCFRTAFGRRIS
jgi:transposase